MYVISQAASSPGTTLKKMGKKSPSDNKCSVTSSCITFPFLSFYSLKGKHFIGFSNRTQNTKHSFITN